MGLSPRIATPLAPPGDADLAMRLQRSLDAAGFAFGPRGDLTELEEVVLATSHSIKCLALFHAFLIALYALLLEEPIGLVCIVGPVAGWWGAHRLSLVLVGVYLAACLLGVGWGFYVFVVRPFKFYQFVLFVISLWILQVVLKFWRYLSAVDPARARILASPRRRHAASQAAHNERAVRRLESGASD